MAIKSIQDILPLVDHPSRYLGTEINTQPKDLAESQIKIALAFPDLYEIGTSHFGMQILYHILNQRWNIAAERVLAAGTQSPTGALDCFFHLNVYNCRADRVGQVTET